MRLFGRFQDEESNIVDLAFKILCDLLIPPNQHVWEELGVTQASELRTRSSWLVKATVLTPSLVDPFEKLLVRIKSLGKQDFLHLLVSATMEQAAHIEIVEESEASLLLLASVSKYFPIKLVDHIHDLHTILQEVILLI